MKTRWFAVLALVAAPLVMAPGSDPCGVCLKSAYDVEVYGPTTHSFNYTYDPNAGPQDDWTGRVELTINDGSAGLDLDGAILDSDCGWNGNVAHCDFTALQAEEITIAVDVPSWAIFDVELC